MFQALFVNILVFRGILDIFIVLGNYNKIGARIGTTATQ